MIWVDFAEFFANGNGNNINAQPCPHMSQVWLGFERQTPLFDLRLSFDEPERDILILCGM